MLKKLHCNKVSMVLLILCAVRVYIQSILPLYPIDAAGVDDMLMVSYANWLGDNNLFLGDYSFYTLLKLPGYGMLLWLNNFLNTRYSVLIGVLYSGGCLLLFKTMIDLTKDSLKAFLTFFITLWCPIMFAHSVGGRIYCIALVPVLTVYIAALYIGAIGRVDMGKSSLFYLSLAGIIYGFYRIIRYDHIWMTLFMVGVSFVVVVIVAKSEGFMALKSKITALLLPFVIGIAFTTALKTIIFLNYGVYATSDFNEMHFAEMCKYLMEIEPVKEYDGVYVSMETIHRAADVSPNLKKLVDNRDLMGWDSQYENGEVMCDLYAWNFRYAADKLHLYNNPIDCDLYFKQICDDLRNAFDSGLLTKRGIIAISPFSAPLAVKDIPRMLKYSIVEGLDNVFHFKPIRIEWRYTDFTSDNPNTLMLEDFTNEEFVSKDELSESVSICGWFFPIDTQDELEIFLFDKDGKSIKMTFVDSPDVYDAKKIEQAKCARVNLDVLSDDNFKVDETSIKIKISLNNKIIYEDYLRNFENGIIIDGIDYAINKVSYSHPNEAARKKMETYIESKQLFESVVKVIQRLSGLMLFFVIVVTIGEMILFISSVIKNKQEDILPLVLKLGLFITIWVIVLMQAERNFSNWDDFRNTYSAGAYIFYSILIGLCINTCIDWGRACKKQK